MSSLRLVLAAAFAVASGLPPAVAAANEMHIGGSVDSLLAYAREHHPEFAAARFEADAAADRVEPAGALPDPRFRVDLRDFTNEMSGGNANLLPARVGSTKYALTQTLPWFGKRDLRREAAAAGADEAGGRVRATWVDLALRIKQTYAMHYVRLHTQRLLRENADLLQRLGDIAQTRYANGLAPQQDVIYAQAERAKLQSDHAMAEGESTQAAVRMRTLLGLPSERIRMRAPGELRVMPPAAALDFTALEARVSANNPQLAMTAARIAAADKGRALAYRNRYPDVTIGISPTQTRNSLGQWDLSFEVNIPLQQDSRRAQEREAERAVDAARLRHEATRNQLLADLGEALAGLEAAQRVEMLVTSSLLPQTELTLQSALAAYETGQVAFTPVIEAQRQILRAQQDLLRARGDQRLRLAEIERLIGEEL